MTMHHFNTKDWQNTKSYVLDHVLDLYMDPQTYPKPAIEDVAWWIDYEQAFSEASIVRTGPFGN